MKNNAEKQLIGLFMAILALMAGTTVASLRNINHSVLSSDWVNHTHAVISEAEGIVSSVNAGEKALRDFLLAGNERDHVICRRGYAEAAEHLASAKGLTRGETAQLKEFLQIEEIVARRADFARKVIEARLKNGLEDARKIINGGGDETSEIQRRVEMLKAEEESLLRERDKESYLQAQNTRWLVFVGVAVNAGILIFMAYLVRDDIRARRRATALLEELNERLEITVKERTRELAAANKELGQQNLEQRWSNQALDHQVHIWPGE